MLQSVVSLTRVRQQSRVSPLFFVTVYSGHCPTAHVQLQSWRHSTVRLFQTATHLAILSSLQCIRYAICIIPHMASVRYQTVILSDSQPNIEAIPPAGFPNSFFHCTACESEDHATSEGAYPAILCCLSMRDCFQNPRLTGVIRMENVIRSDSLCCRRFNESIILLNPF